jgi:hypothetical protein
MRHTIPALCLIATLVLFAADAAQAQVVLSTGGRWLDAARKVEPTIGLGWRAPFTTGWGGEIRVADGRPSLSIRRTWWRTDTFAAARWAPTVAAGIDLAEVGRGARLQPAGYHLEAGLDLPLPESTLLELSARWVVRGDDRQVVSNRFESRYAEFVVGFVFAID